MRYKQLITEAVLPVPSLIKNPAVKILASVYISGINDGIQKLSQPEYFEKFFGELPPEKVAVADNYIKLLIKFRDDLASKYGVQTESNASIGKVYNITFDPEKCADEFVDLYNIKRKRFMLSCILSYTKLTICVNSVYNGGGEYSKMFTNNENETISTIDINNMFKPSTVTDSRYIFSGSVDHLLRCWVESYGTMMHELQHFVQTVVLQKLLNDNGKQTGDSYTNIKRDDPNFTREYYLSPIEYPTLITSTIYDLIGKFTVARTLHSDVTFDKFVKPYINRITKNDGTFLNTLYKNDKDRYKVAVKDIYKKSSDYIKEFNPEQQVLGLAAADYFNIDTHFNVLGTIYNKIVKLNSTQVRPVLVDYAGYGENINELKKITMEFSGPTWSSKTLKVSIVIVLTSRYTYDISIDYGTKSTNQIRDNLSANDLYVASYSFLEDLDTNFMDSALSTLAFHIEKPNLEDIESLEWVPQLLECYDHQRKMTYDDNTNTIHIPSIGIDIEVSLPDAGKERSKEDEPYKLAADVVCTKTGEHHYLSCTMNIFMLLIEALATTTKTGDQVVEIFDNDFVIMAMTDELNER